MSLTILPKPVDPHNFRYGRRGLPISGIVIHIAEGAAAGTDAWFNSPLSGVSAHYLVRKDGVIHRYVKDEDTAYHAGIADHPTWELAKLHRDSINSRTIGIEHEGKADTDITAAQYAASAELISAICLRHHLPIDSLHIAGHRAIRRSKSCPGKVDVDKLISMAAALSTPSTIQSKVVT